MKAILTLVFLCLQSCLFGQCVADTIPLGPPWPPLQDTTATGNDLLCYVPACGTCATSATCTIFPVDGCILVGGDEGWVNAILRDSCNLVLLDTCFYIIPAAAIYGELCQNYTGYTLLTLCRDTAAAVSVEYVPGFGAGWPTLAPIVDIDTLCSPLASIGTLAPQGPQPIIDIITGQAVAVPQAGRVYLQGRRKFILFAP